MPIFNWRFESLSRRDIAGRTRKNRRAPKALGACAALLAAAGFVGLAVPASAHHSTSGYDYTKTLVLTGSVRSFQWGNPHCYVQLMVRDAQGGSREWAIETGTPATNARDGWTKDTLKAGDKITVEIAPARTGAGGTLRMVRLGNGKTLKGAGAMFSAEGGLPSGGPPLPTLQRANPK